MIVVGIKEFKDLNAAGGGFWAINACRPSKRKDVQAINLYDCSLMTSPEDVIQNYLKRITGLGWLLQKSNIQKPLEGKCRNKWCGETNDVGVKTCRNCETTNPVPE